MKANDRRLWISRRTFLEASGALGLTIFATTRLRRKIKPPSNPLPTAPIAHGITTEKWINTSCLNCPARCAITVRVANGKAVRIKGNPLSRVSEGAICPRGHIGLQVVYDPERISTPLKRSNPTKRRDSDPGWQPITWDAALSELKDRLAAVRDGGPEALLLFSGLNTRSDEDLISRFAEAYGTPNLITEESFESKAEKVGRWLADGNYSQIAYDMGQSNYVLAFGAGIVESERPLARNLRMWGKMRREKPTRGKVVAIDPRYSITAAKSDQWVPINPGSDAALALAIANVIISEELYDKNLVNNYSAGFQEFSDFVLNTYSPEQVTSQTGIAADMIRQLAREFGGTRPAVAWAGRGVAGWPNGSMSVYAIFCLNALVGSIDAPGGVMYQEQPQYRQLPALTLDSVAQTGATKPRIDASLLLVPEFDESASRVPVAITSGSPYAAKMGIGFNANFNMTSPGATDWDEALAKLPFYVHVAPFKSEMALYADMVLPSTIYLEQWGYDHSVPGSGFAELKIKQPAVVVEPNARSVGDIVFQTAALMGGSIADSFAGIGDDTTGFVRYRTETIVPFDELTQNGVWVGADYKFGKYDVIFKTDSGKYEFVSTPLKKADMFLSSVIQPGAPRYNRPLFQGDEQQYPLVLLSYQPLLTIENGSQNYPWAQEILLVMHGVGWTNLAELSKETAASLGIRDGDEVWVESPVGKLKLKARVTEWMHPACVAIARGQGHYAPGQWQNGIGVNPNDIVATDYDRLSGQPAMFNTRAKVYRA